MPLTLIASLIAALLAYIAGATPFGYMAGKFRGIDIRDHGSGNIGATNVIRVLGKGIGIPVFILDMLKGLVPVVLTRWWCGQNGIVPDWPGIAAAVGAVLGHNFTFWLGFRGGKGVATSAGIVLALLPLPLAAGVVAWLAVFFISRYVALASIASAVVVPGTALFLHFFRGQPGWPLTGFSILLGLLAIWRHRSNIRRLRDGTENQFVSKSKRTPIA